MSGNFGRSSIIDRLFSSRRLGEWKHGESVRACADDLAAYLTEKGWVVTDGRRRRFIRSVPFWEQFLDPFLFTSDGRKLVMKSSWDESFVVEIMPMGVRWSARPSSKVECMKFEGFNLLLSELHAEYREMTANCASRMESAKEYEYQWASIGKDADKEWLEWMRVCASPNEAFEWASLGAGPESICGWLALGIDLSGAREWINHGVSLRDAEDWIEAGWTPGEAIKRIKQNES